VFDFPGCHDQQLTLGRLVGIRKQNGLEGAEGPEGEPKERTMAAGLGLIDTGIKVFEDSD
jgi:hypothetical protein